MQDFSSVSSSMELSLKNIEEIIDKPQNKWDNVTDILIIQKTDWLECLFPCVCESSNTYSIYRSDSTGLNSLDKLGYFQEQSECPIRTLCQCWRPWKMNYYSLSDGSHIPVASGERPYRIPSQCFCPFQREEVIVEQDSKYLGRIVSPCLQYGRTGCTFLPYQELNIYDENEILVYIISGSCCQAGVLTRTLCLCRCSGPCQFINYSILDPELIVVGEIKNIYNDCLLETFTKSDKFQLHFPNDATQSSKFLLTYAALLIDYDHFENTCCNLP